MVLTYDSNRKSEVETSTFYLRVKEMINVTLQDMAVFLELCINGPPVIMTNNSDWTMECERLLGMAPPMTLRGGALKLRWLRE